MADGTKNLFSGLKGIPILGGLGGDGILSSGATVGTGTGGIILSLDIPPLWKAGLLTVLACVWMISGAIKKPAEPAKPGEAEVPVAPPHP